MFDVHMENLVEPDVTRATRHIDLSQVGSPIRSFQGSSMGQLEIFDNIYLIHLSDSN